MKKYLLAALMVLSTMAMTINDADAKRLGSGGSVGRQSQNVSRHEAPAQPAANQAGQARPAGNQAPAGSPAAASPWKGMLGGALLGLGLGALFSHLGLGGMMGSLLMVGVGIALIMFLMRLFRKKPAVDPYQSFYAGEGSFTGSGNHNNPSGQTPEIGSRRDSGTFDNGVGRPQPGAGFGSDDGKIASRSGMEAGSVEEIVATTATWQIPSDFDVPGFERHAKTYYIRLQAAWDKADIADIREFTTTEMYSEIKLQIQDRENSANFTDVQTINAKLLGIEITGSEYMASVRFVGTIREAKDAPTESFDEVWNLVKPVHGQGGWLLAGIQQSE